MTMLDGPPPRPARPARRATLTLTEFLLARIAEDEEWGRLYGCVDEHDGLEPSPRCQTRVLAECATKRRIVDLHEHADYDGGDTAYEAAAAVASIWADHPDYRKEWA